MATAPVSPAPPKPSPVAVPAPEAKLGKGPGKIGVLVFGVVLITGVVYAGSHLPSDLSGVHNTSIMPYVLLGLALLVALGFEFVNGFHDTANAVATVIYTHSLEPHVAVVWSGFWNFLGALTSSGLVAFLIPRLAVSELARISRPGGRLILTTPNYFGPFGLYRRYTAAGPPINSFVMLPLTRRWVRQSG